MHRLPLTCRIPKRRFNNYCWPNTCRFAGFPSCSPERDGALRFAAHSVMQTPRISPSGQQGLTQTAPAPQSTSVLHSLVSGQFGSVRLSTHAMSPVAVDAQLHWSEPLQSAHSGVQNVFPAEQVFVMHAWTGSQVSPGRQHCENDSAAHRSSPAGQLQKLKLPSHEQASPWHTGAPSQQMSPHVCAVGQPQTPLTQVSGNTHAGEQILGATHCPFWHVPPLPHAWPSGQLATHVPARQTFPVPHAAPSGATPLHFPLRRIRHGAQGFFFRFLPFLLPPSASSPARARSVPPASPPPNRLTRRRRLAPSPSERTIESKMCSSKACPLISSGRDVAPRQATNEDQAAAHPRNPARHPAGGHGTQSGAACRDAQSPRVTGRPSSASSHEPSWAS